MEPGGCGVLCLTCSSCEWFMSGAVYKLRVTKRIKEEFGGSKQRCVQ